MSTLSEVFGEIMGPKITYWQDQGVDCDCQLAVDLEICFSEFKPEFYEEKDMFKAMISFLRQRERNQCCHVEGEDSCYGVAVHIDGKHIIDVDP